MSTEPDQLQSKTFKVSGSEAFIERMLDVLPSLLPSADDNEPPSKSEDENGDLPGGDDTLDDFVAKARITNEISAERKVCAFIYYLTKVQKNDFATTSQIAACFDETGLQTPERIDKVIDNAKNRTKLIRSVARGQYAVTTKGNNIVKDMFKGS